MLPLLSFSMNQMFLVRYRDINNDLTKVEVEGADTIDALTNFKAQYEHTLVYAVIPHEDTKPAP